MHDVNALDLLIPEAGASLSLANSTLLRSIWLVKIRNFCQLEFTVYVAYAQIERGRPLYRILIDRNFLVRQKSIQMNTLYNRFAQLFLILSIFGFPLSFAGGFRGHEPLEKEAEAYFAQMPPDKAYAEATAFKKTGDKSSCISLKDAIYARQGFMRAAHTCDLILEMKALYNLAMVHLAFGEILVGRKLLLEADQSGFAPATRSLAKLHKAMFKYGPDIFKSVSELPEAVQHKFPDGQLHREYAEEIHETLLNKCGVLRIRLTADEQSLYSLTEGELAELEMLSEEVESKVQGTENPCIILLGRSPLFLGMMLKARGQLRNPMVSLPCSGLKGSLEDSFLENLYPAYLTFLSQKLPHATQYFVIDFCHTGSTFTRFNEILKLWGVPAENIHGLALVIKKSEATIENVAFLKPAPHIMERATLKMVYARFLLLPGMGFFSRQWLDNDYYSRILRFLNNEEIEKPIVAHYRNQMEEYVHLRGVMTRELLANPEIPGPEALEIGRIMAADAMGL